MRSRARDSGWSGPVLRKIRLGALVSGALTLSACAYGPFHYEQAPSPHVQYLAQALNSTESEREELWQGLQQQSILSEEEAMLRSALLQSLPGHSGYAPEEAKRKLEALRERSGSEVVAAIASIRLSTLNEIEERFSRIIDIEREMDN